MTPIWIPNAAALASLDDMELNRNKHSKFGVLEVFGFFFFFFFFVVVQVSDPRFTSLQVQLQVQLRLQLQLQAAHVHGPFPGRLLVLFAVVPAPKHRQRAPLSPRRTQWLE